MGATDIVNTILQRVPQINFTTTAVANQGISVFETNIRYIGGMLASEFRYVCLVLVVACTNCPDLRRLRPVERPI